MLFAKAEFAIAVVVAGIYTVLESSPLYLTRTVPTNTIVSLFALINSLSSKASCPISINFSSFILKLLRFISPANALSPIFSIFPTKLLNTLREIQFSKAPDIISIRLLSPSKITDSSFVQPEKTLTDISVSLLPDSNFKVFISEFSNAEFPISDTVAEIYM